MAEQPKLEIKIDNEEIQKHKLFIGTPMYGGMSGGLFSRSIADLSALCTHYKIQLQLHFLFNESLITRARNYICDEFVRSNSDHLMFIDSDIGFDARDVLALMVLQSQNEAYDIIGGPYPKKTISWEKVVQAVNKGLADNNPNDLEKFVGDFVFNPMEGQNQIPLYAPVEVREVGTGFMMIRRTVFEKFAKAYPHYMYRPDHVRTAHFDGSREIMQYFQAEIDGVDYAVEYKKIIDEIADPENSDVEVQGIDIAGKLKELDEKAKKRSKRYLSEDYWFNQKCQAINVKTFLCPWMKLQHMGSYVFGGSLVDLAAAGATATADASLLKKQKGKVPA
jgi:hypothetical protein